MSQNTTLSSADHAAFGRLARRMTMFHDHFRHTWTTIYSACEAQALPASMPVRHFIRLGLQFCSQLETHHDIEEQYIFPVLAQRMPEFRPGADMDAHHKSIHKGLDEFKAYLGECTMGTAELEFDRIKQILDSFRDVLWQHLDEEVENLGADNMKKYWSRDEVDRIPI